jgi:MoaA/NifB/PqqE/SkfB family radical SAM enzyme
MRKIQAKVDKEGRLVLPEDLVSQYGLKPGAQVLIDEKATGLHVHTPADHLGKVYIEPTNGCNLRCVTCVRNVWDEPLGLMESRTFARIIKGLKDFSPPPMVFFGGFGEPLSHPNIIDMVRQVKAIGSRVELITNGTLLTPDTSKGLISAGLDMLWISLDGASPESYADVRLGATLPDVLANMTAFRRACRGDFFFPEPSIGIVFVAMKRNIADLPSILGIANRFQATRILVTNVLPYAADMCQEMLYLRALNDIVYAPSPFRLDLPKINVDSVTYDSLYHALRNWRTVDFAGGDLSESTNRCPFIESGAAAVSWEGNMSPCLPLLHSYVTYLHDTERSLKRHVVGNVNERSLCDLWHTPDYVAFRERVQEFDFSPCTSCGGCDLFESNEEDCFGNKFPTCGACLWGQGVIQCP